MPRGVTMGRDITLIAKRAKDGEAVSDFAPGESDSIMLGLAERLKQALAKETQEERIPDGDRLSQLKLKALDGSLDCDITHVPMDPFGEKHAEVRVRIQLLDDDTHSAVCDAMKGMDFEVAVS